MSSLAERMAAPVSQIRTCPKFPNSVPALAAEILQQERKLCLPDLSSPHKNGGNDCLVTVRYMSAPGAPWAAAACRSASLPETKPALTFGIRRALVSA